MNIERAKTIDGWMYEVHLEWLARQAEHRMFIIELGSFVGRSTRAICDNTHGQVWAVDKWVEDDPFPNAELAYSMFCENMDDHLKSKKLEIVRMSTDDAFEKYFKLHYNFPFFDMVFIDANHDYKQVKRDISNYRQLVRPGGIVSGHDLNHPGVAMAVKELQDTFQTDSLGHLWWITI